jgi:hypothetical protein
MSVKHAPLCVWLDIWIELIGDRVCMYTIISDVDILFTVGFSVNTVSLKTLH